ncbi:MAG: C39 family peptidase [Anaerolineales bacterium]|nr:C39 family peptidase [Anaerolineales bacterium]
MLRPLHLIEVPLARQATPYTCGVAALQSVLHYYGHPIRQDVLARALKSGPVHGTNYAEMVTYCRAMGFEAEAQTEMALEDLERLVGQGTPVIVALQAWADGPIDYGVDWEDGHYAVVVGYDADNLYFMDPSTLGNYTYIARHEFMTRWHDCFEDNGMEVRLHCFGLIIQKGAPVYDPRIVLPME